MIEIPDEAVEVMAEAWARVASGGMWEQYMATTRQLLIVNAKPTARAALEAALPYLAPAEHNHSGRCCCLYAREADSYEPVRYCPACAEHATDAPPPAGDGGLREALTELAKERDSVSGHTPGDYSIRPYELFDLLKAHPAAPAVPQPVDRERVAEVLHESDWRFNHGWKESGRCGEAHREQFYAQADAVLAVLAGEQEQLEK